MSKAKQVLAQTILLFFCPAAWASGFLFCDVEGVIEAVMPHPGREARVFDLSILVSAARQERGERGKWSQSDCGELVGKPLAVRFKIPMGFGKPHPGRRLVFNYSAVDGFDGNGHYAGTSINVSFRRYLKPELVSGR